jgi:hypothetical protein
LDSELETWWMKDREQVQHSDRRKFDVILILTSCSVWKQRNIRVFSNAREQCNELQLIEHIKEELSLPFES